jgi:hypothetical protein
MTTTNNVRFVLTNQTHSDTVRDARGRARQYSRNYKLPCEAVIVENNKPRTIRYLKGYDTIYKNEQNVEGERLITKKQKPAFKDGVLIVPSTMGVLLEFLRKHPCNEANADYSLPDQKITFKEDKPEEKAREININSRRVVDATQAVYNADFESKLIPVARYLGYPVNRESSLIIYDLTQYAQNNPDSLIELLDSSIVQRFDEVSKAVNAGIIKVDANNVSWGDGRSICAVPSNYDGLKYFTEIVTGKQ